MPCECPEPLPELSDHENICRGCLLDEIDAFKEEIQDERNAIKSLQELIKEHKEDIVKKHQEIQQLKKDLETAQDIFRRRYTRTFGD